jgi:hypothetical protein
MSKPVYISNRKEKLPTEGVNPSYTINESIVGPVTTTIITKTISGRDYQKTIVEDSSNGSTSISSWVEV